MLNTHLRKCTEYNFVSKHENSMEVHIGKQESDKFGLCDLEVGNFENLEQNLTICEIHKFYSFEKD